MMLAQRSKKQRGRDVLMIKPLQLVIEQERRDRKLSTIELLELLLELLLEQERNKGLSEKQDEHFRGNARRNSNDHVSEQPESAQQPLKRSRSGNSTGVSSTSIKRVKSQTSSPDRLSEQLASADHQLQAPDPPALQPQTNEMHSFRRPTSNEAFNAEFAYPEYGHGQTLSIPVPQTYFADEDLGQGVQGDHFPGFNTWDMQNRSDTLVPIDCQGAFSGSFSLAYDNQVASPVVNTNAAPLSSDTSSPHLAPIVLHNPLPEHPDNTSAYCLCCNVLAHKSGVPGYFRVKATVLPLCGHFVCQVCITR